MKTTLMLVRQRLRLVLKLQSVKANSTFAVGGVLLLAIAGFISYLLIPSLKNTINMMVMKPENIMHLLKIIIFLNRLRR